MDSTRRDLNITMKKLANGLILAACFCAGWAAPCAAVPITFDFTGSVTQTTFVPNDPFAGAIGTGTSFSGSYTFESTSLDNIPFASNGSYMTFGAPYEFTVTIGGFTFSTSDALNLVKRPTRIPRGPLPAARQA